MHTPHAVAAACALVHAAIRAFAKRRDDFKVLHAHAAMRGAFAKTGKYSSDVYRDTSAQLGQRRGSEQRVFRGQ